MSKRLEMRNGDVIDAEDNDDDPEDATE